jgi:hypothetical protein
MLPSHTVAVVDTVEATEVVTVEVTEVATVEVTDTDRAPSSLAAHRSLLTRSRPSPMWLMASPI